MDDISAKEAGYKLLDYCEKYFVPFDHIFSILEDQKVTPMIRGKGTEYNVFLELIKVLDMNEWSCQKLNLSAQQNSPDEDITITHRRTGRILKVEAKSAVRGSISDGKKARIHKVPHFKVKCHRSRSNVKLAETSNDRYSVDSFDIIITNVFNAIIKGATVGPDLEVKKNRAIRDILYGYYGVSNEDDLKLACHNDWRFVLPETIAIDGFVPRTPYVLLENDSNWMPFSMIEKEMLKIVKKPKTKKSRR